MLSAVFHSLSHCYYPDPLTILILMHMELIRNLQYCQLAMPSMRITQNPSLA
jgi:hypothetical protein